LHYLVNNCSWNISAYGPTDYGLAKYLNSKIHECSEAMSKHNEYLKAQDFKMVITQIGLSAAYIYSYLNIPHIEINTFCFEPMMMMTANYDIPSSTE
jgi:hypothetical protein